MAEGFTIWFDKARLEPGFNWHREIEDGCENSRVLLPVLTPRWKESEWTKFETYGAEAVIPLIFEGNWHEVSTPPLERFQAQRIEVTEPQLAWVRIFAMLHRVLAQAPPDKIDRISHVRYLPNPYFVGREQELVRIHEELHSNPRTVLTQGRVRVVAALGGVGKTTLARHYVEKFWRCYSQVFWVDCRLGLESEFAQIHDLLFPDLANAGKKDSERAALALLTLAKHESRLLVLDNAENEESVMRWIPKTGGCHTLITSRYTAWSASIRTFALYGLDKISALEFLQGRVERRVYDGELTACDTLAGKLGYLPLALEQAAAYIQQQGEAFGFRDYLDEYERSASELLAAGVLGSTEYPDSVATTWKPTLARLGPDARMILRLAAQMAETPIPIKMFTQSAEIVVELAGSRPRQGGAADFQVAAAIRDLKAYSMITSDGKSLSLHPLLRRVEKVDAAASGIDYGPTALDIFLSFAPESADLPRTWAVWNGLFPHAVALQESGNNAAPRKRIELLDHMARFAFGKAQYTKSVEFEQQAYGIAEATFGAESPEMEDRLMNYGEYLRACKRYDEAERFFRRCLEWREKHYGHDSLPVAASLNYLGLLTRMTDREAESEGFLREGIAICQRCGINSDPTLLKLLLNLAMIALNKSDLDEAQQLAQRAQDVSAKEFGGEDLFSAYSDEILGAIANNRGDYAAAVPVFRRSAERQIELLGENHPETLEAMSVLAIGLVNAGHIEEALSWRTRIAKIILAEHGIDSQQSIESGRHVGELLLRLGRFEAALQLGKQSLTASEKLNGLQHPETLLNLVLVAGAELNLGQIVDAAQDFSRIEKDLDALPAHTVSNIYLSMRRLALSMFLVGNYSRAESMLRNLIERGFEVASNCCHLARVLIMLNREEEAASAVAVGWKNVESGPKYVKPRLLFLEILLRMLKKSEWLPLLTQLRQALSTDAAYSEWKLEVVLDHVAKSLDSDLLVFLGALLAALSDRTMVSGLERFKEWGDAAPA